MWTRGMAGADRVAPAIVGLAFFSVIAACAGLASAQNANQIREQALQHQQQVRQAQQQFIQNQQQQASTIQQQASKIQQDILQQEQLIDLTHQIGDLQVASANLTIQIADMYKAYPAEVPPAQKAAPPAAGIDPVAQSPQLKAAMQAIADARSACDSLKQKLLASVHDSAEYKQDAAALESERASMERAKAAGDDVVALAYKILADETALRKREPQALDASADWKAANVRLEEATKSLAAIRSNLDQAGNKNAPAPGVRAPANAQGPGAQIRDLIAERDKVNAQEQALLKQVAATSTYNARLLAQQGEGILEELTQLHQQQQQQVRGQTTAAGAPLIRFSPQVSPQVQQFLQGNLDESERLKNPVYAAEKAREAQEQADLQQQKAQQEAERQQEEQQREAQEDEARQQQEQQRQAEEEQARQQRELQRQIEESLRNN